LQHAAIFVTPAAFTMLQVLLQGLPGEALQMAQGAVQGEG
jgi:hypothetical protein